MQEREIVVTFCVGPECTRKGAAKVRAAVKDELTHDEGITFREVGCLNRCTSGPNVCGTDENPTLREPVICSRVGKTRLFDFPKGPSAKEVAEVMRAYRDAGGSIT